ncbi:ABC transporter ATP-binding protein [Planosporangium thailandense]|uniref:ABC transporter ATP-binding protein n=1 Tax=Planosporangium thailandense TaxID=765197 RepID=A0ABX0Y511_9ACTN|nr:ABC transporter ATP-binding protein [Planosporangium thailandense]
MAPQLPAGTLRAAGSRVLRQAVRQHPFLVLLFTVVTGVGAVTTVLMPRVVAAAIDAATTGTNVTGALAQLAALLAIATAASALDDLIGSYYGTMLTAGFRHRLLGRALALGVPGLRRFPAGDLLSRITVNAGTPAMVLPMLLSATATLSVTLGAVVSLALIDLRLAVTLLLGVPPSVALLRLFVATAAQPFVRYQELLAAITTRLLDAHRGVRTIRAGGTAEREIGRILQPVPELHEVGRQGWVVQGRASWQLALLVPVVQLLVLSVGGYALVAGQITAGQLVAAASYAGLALGSMGLLDTLVSLLSCQVGAGRVGEVLEAVPAAPAPASPVAVPPGYGRLELRNISVRMDDRPVLDHLYLAVPAGRSVAIVGRSGTGKSVLVSLIGRLADPDEGQVLLDGVPVAEIEPAALRRTVTYAFERPALLGATIHDMIAYGRPAASRAEVEAAAAVAQADRFIRLLPKGYDTPLAQAPMSGGEMQRLGLARAILARARVIVLDDATSSLDTATEAKVARALARVLAGRTSVVVAHRAMTAARADLVAWLDGGRVRALAPHSALWSDPGYRAVFGAADDTGAGEIAVRDVSGMPAALQVGVRR